MIPSKAFSSGKPSSLSAGKLKPQLQRGLTVGAAIPPVLPELADIPVITCTTTAGKVSCVDDRGDSVVGTRLKELQAILRPIAEAPALEAKVSPAVNEEKSPVRNVAESKPVETKSSSESKPVLVTPIADTKPSSSEGKPVSTAKPQVDKSSGDVKLVAEAKPKLESALPESKDSSKSAPAEVLPALAEAKPAAKEAISKPVPESGKPAPAEVLPSIAEAKLTPKEPVAQAASEPEAKKAEAPQTKTVSSSPSPTPATPATTPEPTKEALKPVKASSDEPTPKTASVPDTPKPPAPTTASSQSSQPQSPSTATSDLSTSPPPTTTVSNASTETSAASPARTKPKSTPATLSSPDQNKDVRAIIIARGEDASFSTGVSSSGNSSAPFNAPIRAASQQQKAFPGNVDPSEYLQPQEFGDIVTTIGGPSSSKAPSQVKTINVLNERGLIPGNMPPELGDILQLVNAINAASVNDLTLRVFPGNVPPDAPFGAAAPTVLEFAPGSSGKGGKDVKSVHIELQPGNVPPGSQLGDMLDFLGSPQVGV